jgi:hypothetical protein
MFVFYLRQPSHARPLDQVLARPFTITFSEYLKPKLLAAVTWGLLCSWLPILKVICAILTSILTAGADEQDAKFRPAGQVLLDLVRMQWCTDAEGATDARGEWKIRDFQGGHVIIVQGREKRAEVHASLPAAGIAFEIALHRKLNAGAACAALIELTELRQQLFVNRSTHRPPFWPPASLFFRS